MLFFCTVKAADSKQGRKRGSNDDGDSNDSSDVEAEGSSDDDDDDDSDSDQESVASESEDDDDPDVSQSDVTLMTSFGGKHKEVSDDEDTLLKYKDEERQQTLKSLRKHHR